MKKYCLEKAKSFIVEQTVGYVADLYRANYVITKNDIAFMKELRPFSLLLIKTPKSRTLPICPPREIRDMRLSTEAIAFLTELGVKTIISDTAGICGCSNALKVLAPVSLQGIEPGYYSCVGEEDSEELVLNELPQGFLPLGVRRDGSLYSRIQWASTTEKNPYYWVCNLIDDDIERNGGTWGANTMGPANAILDFFGEEMEISMIRIFHNVGSPISIEQEMAEKIRLYVCSDERCAHFGTNEEDIDIVKWEEIVSADMEMKEQWNTYFLQKPVKAKYIRIELVKNFGTPPDVPWTETAELKVFPPK